MSELVHAPRMCSPTHREGGEGKVEDSAREEIEEGEESLGGGPRVPP